VEWARRQGIDAMVREHLDIASVQAGDIVLGTLPVHIVAALGAKAPLQAPRLRRAAGHARQGAFGDDLERLGARLVEYRVEQVGDAMSLKNRSKYARGAACAALAATASGVFGNLCFSRFVPADGAGCRRIHGKNRRPPSVGRRRAILRGCSRLVRDPLESHAAKTNRSHANGRSCHGCDGIRRRLARNEPAEAEVAEHAACRGGQCAQAAPRAYFERFFRLIASTHLLDPVFHQPRAEALEIVGRKLLAAHVLRHVAGEVLEGGRPWRRARRRYGPAACRARCRPPARWRCRGARGPLASMPCRRAHSTAP